MTDSERLAEIAFDFEALKGAGWFNGPEIESRLVKSVPFLLRLLDTTRSERDAALREVEALKHDIESALDGLSKEAAERDAALARVGALERAARFFLRYEDDLDPFIEHKHAVDELRAALTPPAYPPEQPL